jgi:hypothetical protein
MDDASTLAARQLGRMRGMTRYYHARFFSDIRFSLIATLALFTLSFWEIPDAVVLVPPVALLGAVATAFDASYLIFARQYAARLEDRLNRSAAETILVGAELEASYLFPLDERKIVTARFGGDFTWFGFVTLFYTGVGVATYVFGLALALPRLGDHGGAWQGWYLITLLVATVAALGVGLWWFVGGEGERRLRAVLDAAGL